MTGRVIIIFFNILESFPYPNIGGGGLIRELHFDLKVIKKPNESTVLLQLVCDAPTRNDGPKSEWTS